jgi:FAD:protein FMN transferase
MVLTADTLYEKLDAAPLHAAAGFYRVAFSAMGSPCHVDFAAPTRAAADEFRRDALRWLAEFEAGCSRFLPGSVISRINEAAGREWVSFDTEIEGLFALCDWYHWSTRGLFDPTALPLIRLWDYHAANPVVPGDAAVRDAMAKVGWEKVQRRPGEVFLSIAGMGLDLGGIGKEYAVDRMMELALGRGIQDVLVNFGNDVRAHGHPPEKGPWKIGLEDPADPGRCWAGVAVTDRAVCSSGDYLRNFKANGRTYGHILDPRNGYPVSNGCRSVSVVAPTCTEAGILSTSAFILGGHEGIEFIQTFQHAEGCLWQGGSRLQTRRFHDYVI